MIGVSIEDFKEEKWNPTSYFHGLLHDESSKGRLSQTLLQTNISRPQQQNSKNQVSPLDFGCYLGIIASPPKDFTEFSNQVNYYMEQEPFRYPNLLAVFGKNKRIRIEAAYLYDAVVLYSQVVRSILQEEINSSITRRSMDTGNAKGDQPVQSTNNINNSSLRKSAIINLMDSLKRKIFNGVEIASRLRNTSYKSATGHDSEMDGNGDARGNFTLVSLKLRNGEYGIYPVGIFLKTTTTRSTEDDPHHGGHEDDQYHHHEFEKEQDDDGGKLPVSETKYTTTYTRCEHFQAKKAFDFFFIFIGHCLLRCLLLIAC